MSTSLPDRHPLDTDLLDLIDGTLEPASARAVQQHLATCVLCRIKQQRLADQSPYTFTEVGDVTLPSFEPVTTVTSQPTTARAGELWLTTGDEAAMVLVRKVLDSALGLVVVPVTFDIEVADNGTLVLDAAASPLSVPIAIYDKMLSGIPTEALSDRVEPRQEVDLLAIADGDPGITRGTPMEGLGDPRHEVRQYLSDRLTRLSPLEGDKAEEMPSPPSNAPERDFASFRQELDDLRAEGLHVETTLTLTSCPDTWVGLGQVTRRHQSVGVIGTPAGLISDYDFVAARSFVLRAHLSAIIVCPRDGETVDLFTPDSLYDGYDVPSGTPGRRPFVDTHGLGDSIRKFLGARENWNVPFASASGQVERIDVPELLNEAALEATSGLANGNFRGEKREGWQRAANYGDELAALLRTAADGDFDLSKVAQLGDEDDA